MTDWDPAYLFLFALPFIVAAVGLARDSVMFTALGTLCAFWVVLSGQFTPFLLIAGLGCAIAVLWLARRMEIVDREAVPVDFWRATATYWPWLVKEIIKSGWDVTRIILSPRLPISPTVVRFTPTQRSKIGLVTHANSITLTPGTITMEIEDGEFEVHALTAAGAASLAGSEMDRRVRALEGAP